MSSLGLVFVTCCGISLQGILQFGAMLLERVSSGYSGGFFLPVGGSGYSVGI